MGLSLESPPLPLLIEADGTARVGGTRVALDTVMAAFNQGATPEEIVQGYPTLDLGDVYAVIGFAMDRGEGLPMRDVFVAPPRRRLARSSIRRSLSIGAV